MQIIEAFLLITIILLIIDFFVTRSVYGNPIKPEVFSLVLERKNSYSFNKFDRNILTSNVSPYISKIGMSFFFKYNIDGCGVTWRFSKESYIIDEFYKSATEEHIKNIFL